MPNIQDRPFVGTWKLNNRPVIKYTPDALVYINGDTTVPGCGTCNGRIDLQPLVKSINIEASTQPGGHSANIQLNVPRVYGQSLFVDGKFLIRPTLEVHIYMRGWFPVTGMYAQLSPGESQLPQFEDADGAPEATNIEGVPQYPYYHVFHGVVTQVNHDYADGFYTATIACASMLHFWQYQTVAVNGAAFGTRARNSGVKLSLIGHNLSGMSPYGIIYMLYKDSTGALQGVNFALSDKTNNNATSQVNGQSLYSMSLLYWERRFKQSMYSLRLHGTTGKLFNGAQQAFLGSARSQDIKNILKGSQYIDGSKNSLSRDIFGDYLVFAKRLKEKGTKDGDKVGNSLLAAQIGGFGLDFAYSEMASENEVGHNLIDAQAFVSDVSNWGNISLWETEYETKLDIAHKVTQVTGFEFYQDVDGDFVFKPPFYNMDTSKNRVYVIEETEIINFNVMEKEPTATMVTLKGDQHKNLNGVGLDGAWGKRGQYIDYRLVAQFGWRPHSMDVSYFNNPRSLFYAAVNKLDLINIDVNAATLTIPIRAELRPGYPIYIPRIDSYYYITAFNHAFQFGGQCVTTMTLTARRSKFYAPGRRPENGSAATIDSIKLDNPYLPPTPLIIAKDGDFKLSGFPNVVMALDPEKLNPKYSILGSISFEAVTTENINYFGRIIDEILNSSIQVLGVCDDNEDAEQSVHGNRFCMAVDGDSQVNVEDFNIDSATFKADFFDAFTKIQELRKSIDKTQQELKGGKFRRDKKEKAEAEKSIVSNQAALVDFQTSDSSLVRIVLAYQNSQIKNNDVQGRANLSGTKDPVSTAAYLDLLSDQKANFVSDNFPGYYRYYSASHPDAKFQGMLKMREADATDKTPAKDVKDNEVASVTTPSTVLGYVQETDGTTPFDTDASSGAVAENALGPVTVTHGLQISSPRGGTPKIVPTHLIQTIAFSPIVQSKAISFIGLTQNSDFNLAESDYEKIVSAMADRVIRDVLAGPVTIDEISGKSMKDTIIAAVENLNAILIAFIDNENAKLIPRTKFPTIEVDEAGNHTPDQVQLGFETGFFTSTVDIDLPLGNNRRETPPNGVISGSEVASINGIGERLSDLTIGQVLNLKKKSSNGEKFFRTFKEKEKKLRGEGKGKKVSPKGVLKAVARHYVNYFVGVNRGDISLSLKAEIKFAMKDAVPEAKSYLAEFFNEVIFVLTETAFTTKGVNKKGGKGRLRIDNRVNRRIRNLVSKPTPVFPVSDGLGYEVIGSYRYGRGIDVGPGGTMQQIYEEGNEMMRDHFDRIDAETVDLFLTTMQKSEVQDRALVLALEDPEFRKAIDAAENSSSLSPEGRVQTLKTLQKKTSASIAAATLESIKGSKDADTRAKALQFEGFVPKEDGIETLEMDLSQKQNAWINGFANSVVTGHDQNFKLPVANNAFRMRDIQQDLSINQKGLCMCRAAEADIRLEALGKTKFLSLEADNANDPAVKFTQEQMIERSIVWHDNRKAMAGARHSDPTELLFESWERLKDSFENSGARFVAEIEAAGAEVNAALDAFG